MLRIYCLNVSHVYDVYTMKRGAPVANSRIKSTHNRGITLLCVCAYMCENVHSFVYSFKISIFSPHAFIGVVL